VPFLSQLAHSEDEEMASRPRSIGPVLGEELEALFKAYPNTGVPEPVIEGGDVTGRSLAKKSYMTMSHRVCCIIQLLDPTSYYQLP